MNERIKELAKEAGYKPLPGFDFANSLEETYLKKFAELIVQDCVSEVALMGVTNFENEDISWCCSVIIDNIKNRFGV
jgi:hypothetical protein